MSDLGLPWTKSMVHRGFGTSINRTMRTSLMSGFAG